MNGRHYNMTILTTCKNLPNFSPDVRENHDYVFIGECDSYKTLKQIYENYGGIFSTFDNFYQIFNELTRNSTIMVINLRSRSTLIDDCVFWTKIDHDLNDNFNSDSDDDFIR